MYPGHNVSFASFQMNLTSYQIWCDGKPIPLQPMPARILAMLVQRADLIVPYAAFNTGIWGAGEHLDELKVHISTIRKVLGDQAKTPRFIQTYRGYGYQFMMPVTYDDGVREEQATVEAWPMVPLRQIVGREASLARLHDWLERAQEGTRQIVLVTGEAGIGKTTVVEAFVQQISVHPRPRLGQAQCLTHYGVSEPYMPILEALRQLCQPPEGHTVVTLLSRVAPTWLLQMPWLLSEEDAERLQRRMLGTTPQRMLREIVQALETLTHTRPLVLVLEDLHWSDTATLDVLSLLARRQETARLLLLGTYRPEEIRGTGHPLFALIQDLQMRGYCQELALPLLSVTAVRAYLTARFPGMPLPEGLAQFIHTRTDGNPLFMVNLIEHVASQGIVGAQAIDAAMELEIPHSLRQIIEQRLDQFTPEERQVCEVASVAGTEFTAAMVAAGMGESLELVETWCANLARRGLWLRSHGPRLWPDGTASEAYSFVHSLYQNVLYAQVTIARRQRLHRLLGACLERGYGAQTGEVAVMLAQHSIAGQDYRRAVSYLMQAAQHALQRCAYREAMAYLTRGLALLEHLPRTRERSQQELALQLALAAPLMATKGYGAPDVEQAYVRARALCEWLGDDASPELFQALFGLRGVYMARAELHKAHDLAQQSLSLAQRSQDQRRLLGARYMLGATLFHLGEVEAHTYMEQAAAHLPSPPGATLFYGHDIGVACLSYAAWVAWWCGYAQQARQRSQAALALAHALDHPFSLAFAYTQAAMVHQFHHEVQAAQEQATRIMALAQEQGFALWHAVGTILHGWCLGMQGASESGLAQIQHGLTALQNMGTRLMQPYLLALLAEACQAARQPEAGLTALTEGLTTADQTREHWYDAELYRLQGELRLQQEHTSPEAERDLLHALTLARQQQTKSLELRAILSLSRLWQRQGKRDAVHLLLAETARWCTVGAGPADLPEAAALRADWLVQRGGNT